MSHDCDDCERLPLNEYPLNDIVREIEEYRKELSEYNITALEEVCREWRETH